MRFLIPGSYHELVAIAGSYDNYTLPDTGEILRQMGFQYLTLHAQSPMFYVVDYVNQKYLYIDPSIKFVLGYEPEAIREKGPLHFTGLWHPNDYNIFSNYILPESLAFLRSREIKEYPEFSFSFNYRIKANDGSYRTMLQRSTYFLAAQNGYPLAAVGFALDITHFYDNTQIIYTVEKVDRNLNRVSHDCLYKKTYYPDSNSNLFTKRETEVLQYLRKGMSSKAIADKMYVSVNTIHNHRKNMLKKTGCKNTGELLHYVAKQGVL